MATDKPRFTITVEEELLRRIDDFRFENRIPTRTEATIRLIELGIKSLEVSKCAIICLPEDDE